MRRRKSMGLRNFSQPQPRSAFQPTKRFASYLRRNRMLAYEFVQRDRKARAAKIARDLSAGMIDRQNRIVRTVREKNARLSDSTQRNEKTGRKCHHVRK